MILAAGFGTRLKPHSLCLPKPLFPVMGRPLLSLLLAQLKDEGAGRIVVNAHHLSGRIKEAVADAAAVVFQHEKEILGTGGGLRRALPHFRHGAPVLVTNGDIVHDISLAAVYHHHLEHGNRVTLVLHDCPRFNNVLVRDGLVRGFGGTAPGTMLAFTGIHVIDPGILRQIPENSFYNIIDLYRRLLAGGEKIGVFRADPCVWRDIGTPEDYLQLHGDLLHRRLNLPWLRRFAADNLRSFPFFVNTGAMIGRNTELRDWVWIGGNVRIGNDTTIARCVIWDGARVPAGDYRDMIISGFSAPRSC